MQKRFLKYFWLYTKDHKIRFVFLILATLTAVIISYYLSPLILAKLFDHIQNETLNRDNSIKLLIYYSLLRSFGLIVVWRVSSWLNWTLTLNLAKQIFDDLFQKMTKKSANFYSNNFSGSITSNFNRFIYSVAGLI